VKKDRRGTTPTEETTAELSRFVRETLGCGCPAEVLSRIAVEDLDSGGRGLDVGGRLLVRLLPSESVDHLIDGFPDRVLRLCDERDRRGFNRLRMVVICDHPEEVHEALSEMLAIIAPSDDRVHVHALPPGSIPSALSARA
jgi:hypothetical protein